MLWLGWVGVTLSWQFTLGFMGSVCIAWFLINLFCVYLHQRRVVARWNTAYAVWKSGGSVEDYLKEMGRNQECLALLKSIWPKIQNLEVQKALAEIETELSIYPKQMI